MSVSRLDYNELMIEALLEHHETLEEVTFHGDFEVDGNFASHSIQQLLSTCSKLTRFLSYKGCYSPALNYRDMIQAPWVCTNLRSLCLVLDPTVAIDSPMKIKIRRTLGLKFSTEIYSRIGTLTQLQDLELDYASHEGRARTRLIQLPVALNLDCGLRELKGLKRLCRLKLSWVMWEGVGQEECEFMAREWPSLDQIEFTPEWPTADQIGYDPFEGWKPYWQALEADHWRWLKTNRPNVRFTCEGAYDVV